LLGSAPIAFFSAAIVGSMLSLSIDSRVTSASPSRTVKRFPRSDSTYAGGSKTSGSSSTAGSGSSPGRAISISDGFSAGTVRGAGAGRSRSSSRRTAAHSSVSS